MLYGLVSGLSIRSRSVPIASVCGFLVSSGSESNCSRGETDGGQHRQRGGHRQDRPRRRATSRIERRRPRRSRPRALSPRGRHRVIAAGRKAIVQTKAISMPTPAISPSSATPAKLVGTKARKPAAVAAAATRIWPPTRRAFCRIASAGSGNSNRRSR